MSENKIAKYTLKGIKDKKFIVPFFQRDYAWESQNLKDLIDDGQKKLYIGNIVVKNGLIIDGQQRLMSLYLLSKFVGKDYFEIRYEVDDSDNKKLKNLNSDNFKSTEFEMSSLNDICYFLSRNLNKNEIEDCLENVYFTITELSDDINPGKYFEAMNTNKQQLKHHEILKAKFFEKLSSNTVLDMAENWDNCSNMDSYFVEKKYLKDNSIQKEAKSIIKFEDFLCVVARVIGVDDMPLDTKYLVRNFEDKILETGKSEEFIKELFKYRAVFDKYLFKRNFDNTYIFKRELDDKYKSTIDDKKLLMIQLLFEVQNSNEWLVSYLKECENLGDDLNAHIEFLENLDKEKMQERVQDLENLLNSGTSTPHYFFYKLDYLLWKKLGEEMANNEFEIWEGVESKQSIYDNFFITRTGSVEHIQPQSKASENDFEGVDENGKSKIDTFGNLALISSSRNSSLGNKAVNEKKAVVDNWIKGKQSIQSLKMLLAFQKYFDCWNYDNAEEHGKDMINLLKEDLGITSLEIEDPEEEDLEEYLEEALEEEALEEDLEK
ncbi:DUF262 domain-containing protein [Campylobacter corcagiensis]|uniref:DUF262 domain-containing protein n=1 Tax=Campylobacter corcagiensis TaxID=1448857 RepID=A0A7M1LFS3_9BACT|nr:DUF262 domain-containing protein [Campylobacter corcagiensis]QKF64915.1 DUF262 and DUF1524 domain-containing protein [Campylobacter corcagiensis]QOQ86924.1 DUF262 domain-containing protein [Campylobacter corcagiensis]